MASPEMQQRIKKAKRLVKKAQKLKKTADNIKTGIKAVKAANTARKLYTNPVGTIGKAAVRTAVSPLSALKKASGGIKAVDSVVGVRAMGARFAKASIGGRAISAIAGRIKEAHAKHKAGKSGGGGAGLHRDNHGRFA